MAADKDMNKVEDFLSVMTPEEIEALKLGDEGFDFGDSDEFDPVEVKLARETIEERTRREAEGGDFAHDEAAAKAEEDLAEGKEHEPQEDEAEDTADGDQSDDAAADPAPEKPEPLDTDLLEEAMAAVDKDIEARIEALTQKYDEAEITTAEFKQQIADLNAGRRDAINEKVGQVKFDQALRAFFADNAGLKSDDHIQGLDAAFTAVDLNPAFKGASDREKLDEAHRIYFEQTERARQKGWTKLEVPAPKDAAKPATPPAQKPAEAQPPEKKPDGKLGYKPRPEGEAPKTLARMPASDSSVQGGTKADTIMRLLDSKDPDAIEKALKSNAITLSDLEEIG